MLHLVGRALVDSAFFKFVSKIPKLLETYQLKSFEQDYVKYHEKLENRLKQNYLSYYTNFRETFGLKLNYSI